MGIFNAIFDEVILAIFRKMSSFLKGLLLLCFILINIIQVFTVLLLLTQINENRRKIKTGTGQINLVL